MNILHRNNVNVFGSGRQPMVFAHGFGADQSIWRYITPEFESAYKIVLFDYVGCGLSDRNAYDAERYATLDGYAQDVVEVCEALELKDVIFVAHSVSGMIGILAAKLKPELFKSMIMLGPSACYINEPGYEGGFEREQLEDLVLAIGAGQEWAGGFATTALGGTKYPELTEELIRLFCSMEPGAAQQFAKATLFSDHRSRLQDHKVQTLVLQGSRDQIAPVSAGEYIRRSMQNSSLVELDTDGHFPQLNAPSKTITAMWNYLYQSWEGQTLAGPECLAS